MKQFSIKDSKAEAYLPPFLAITTGVAMRIFQNAVMKEGTDFMKYAADYTLFEIGEWDELNGRPIPHDANKNIINGLDVQDMTIAGGE